MLPYWLIFILAALGTVASMRTVMQGQAVTAHSGRQIEWAVYLFIIFLMIGLRHDVGGDWSNYQRHILSMKFMSLKDALTKDDPGYYFLNWVFGNIYMVNTVCAAISVIGLSVFARTQPYPWLGILVAIPYMIIVVFMGYTRQAAALSFVMIGLSVLSQNRQRAFVFWIICGALFHKSAVLLLPIAALSATSNRFWTYTWVFITTVTCAVLFLLNSAEQMWVSYVEREAESEGALIRTAMNAVPSILLLLYRKHFFSNMIERKLWTWMAVLALVCFGLVSFASTAVDRMALYFIPLQIFVFTRLPFVFGVKSFNLITFAIIAYYGLVLLVWLNFASHAGAWLPYTNLIHAFIFE